MIRRRTQVLLGAVWTALLSCAPSVENGLLPPLETSISFTNLSVHQYASLRFAASEATGVGATMHLSPLLAPGGTYLISFRDALEAPCPSELELRVLLYERVNTDVPIGLDPGEVVNDAPVAAGILESLPLCGATESEVDPFTVVVWESAPGAGRVKLAQGTPLESLLVAQGVVDNETGVWSFAGVDGRLVDLQPPIHLDSEPIAGRVQLAGGLGLEGVGVLLRTRFRHRLDDDDSTNDPDAGFSEPIAFTQTDENGAFELLRPPGAYRVEFFADDLAFRPAIVDLQTPSERVITIAEVLP